MEGVLAGFGLIGVIIAVGYLLGRFGVLGQSADQVISRLAFFVGAPALMFTTLASSPVSLLTDTRSLISYGSAVAMILIYVAIARLGWRRPAGETIIGGLCSGYVNAGNLGIPIAVYALGGAGAMAPTLMFQLVILAPTSFILLDLLARRGGPRSLRTALTPLLNPLVIAAAAGIACAAARWQPPEMVMAPIDTLAGLAVPAMILAFGISLHGAPLLGRSEMRLELTLVVILKSVVQPALAGVLGLAVGLDRAAILTAVVIAALPTAQNVFTYAMRYSQGVMLARESVLVTTIVSVPVVIIAAAVLG